MPPDFDDIYRHLDDLRRWFDALVDPETDPNVSPDHHELLRSLRALAEDAEYRVTRAEARQHAEGEGSSESPGTALADYHAFCERASRDALKRARAALGPDADPSDLANLASDLEHDILLSGPEPPAGA